MLVKETNSRFLTIGFSRDHDAVFLNKIAQSGSEQGNFFYVDTSQDNYPELVKECLRNSLSLAQAEDGLVLKIRSESGNVQEKAVLQMTKYFNPESDEEVKVVVVGEDAEMQEVEKIDNNQIYDFTKQVTLSDKILSDFQA